MKRELKRKGSSLKTAFSGKRTKPDPSVVVGPGYFLARSNEFCWGLSCLPVCLGPG